MTGDTNRSSTGGASPDDQLHVLSIVHSATFGGPHNQAVQLHRVLAGDGGARLTVVLPDEPGDAAGRLRAAGVTVIQLPLLRPRASAASRVWAPWSPGTRARSSASGD